ncbi:hypothetical protein [Shinella zoogloeoides]|uniref:hypothetical protein n=1 Tax=Shinella zoogloeoides TaxID=352475 RepID=UPI0028ABE7C5|nr:hypothetical protein [Shinella zoogloeoides]
MIDRTPRSIFPIEASDIGPEAAAAARDRDAHLETLVIGIFVGAAVSTLSILLGAMVLA